jgi:hypothetical protein
MFELQMPAEGRVDIRLFDFNGRQVATLASGAEASGRQRRLLWPGGARYFRAAQQLSDKDTLDPLTPRAEGGIV